MSLITSHPLPGRPLGTDLGKQRPQHLLAGCSGSFILLCTASIIQTQLIRDYLINSTINVVKPEEHGKIGKSSQLQARRVKKLFAVWNALNAMGYRTSPLAKALPR